MSFNEYELKKNKSNENEWETFTNHKFWLTAIEYMNVNCFCEIFIGVNGTVP